MVTLKIVMRKELQEYFTKEFLKSKNLAIDPPNKLESNMNNLRCTHLELELKWFLYSKGIDTPPIKHNSNSKIFSKGEI